MKEATKRLWGEQGLDLTAYNLLMVLLTLVAVVALAARNRA